MSKSEEKFGSKAKLEKITKMEKDDASVVAKTKPKPFPLTYNKARPVLVDMLSMTFSLRGSFLNMQALLEAELGATVKKMKEMIKDVEALKKEVAELKNPVIRIEEEESFEDENGFTDVAISEALKSEKIN